MSVQFTPSPFRYLLTEVRVYPPPTDFENIVLDNVILAPHALCWTDQCFAGNGAADIRAVLDVQHGRVPRGVVNRSVVETDAFKARLAGFAGRYGA